jgi:hypothetical protein
MAEVPSRMFWSIARYFHGDIDRGLRELVPDVDGSFP